MRDVSFGEDACRIARPKAAGQMVTLRNLTKAPDNLMRHSGNQGAVASAIKAVM